MKYKKITYIVISSIFGFPVIFCAVNKNIQNQGNTNDSNNLELSDNPSENSCQYSDNPISQNCVNCALELVCLSPNKYGAIVEYSGKNEDGSVVTQIPTTTCDQEGYWSCPSLSVAVAQGYPSISLPPQYCPALPNNTTLMGWPSFMIVKNKNAFQTMAIEACKRGAPPTALDVIDFGLRSQYDWTGRTIDNQLLPSWNKNTIHHIISTDRKPQGDLPFNRLFVFGDSISDTANRYVFYPHPFDTDGYFYHRYSNGPLWVEYIARKFHNTKNEIELIDVAVAGSAVTPGLGDQYTILMKQVEYALNILNPNNQPFESKLTTTNTVFSLMAGMIDFRDVIEDFWRSVDPKRPGSDYYTGRLQKCWDSEFPGYNNPDVNAFAHQCVSKILFDENNSIRAAALKLIGNGARYFIIPELPDFTLLPRYNKEYTQYQVKPNIPPQKVNDFIQALASEFNEQLTTKLIPELENYDNTKIIKLDLYNIYQQLVSGSTIAKAAGITYVTAPGMASAQSVDLASVLYWDDVHPSETANCVIAERTYELMYQKFGKTYTPNYNSCHHSYIQRNPSMKMLKPTPRKYIR